MKRLTWIFTGILGGSAVGSISSTLTTGFAAEVGLPMLPPAILSTVITATTLWLMAKTQESSIELFAAGCIYAMLGSWFVFSVGGSEQSTHSPPPLSVFLYGAGITISVAALIAIWVATAVVIQDNRRVGAEAR
jgi:CHASE1-domain containing sensor protein